MRFAQRSSALLLALAVACGDDAAPEGPSDSGIDAAVFPGAVFPGASAEPRADVTLDAARKETRDAAVDAAAPQRVRYVIASWVTTPELATTYIKGVPDIAADTKLDVRTDAIEFEGYGDVKVLGNTLYVSGREEASITSYTIAEDGRLSEQTTLDFSSQASSSNIFEMTFLSPTAAYLVGDSGWVRWNPSTMRIETDKFIPFPDSVRERDGIAPYYAFDRGFAVRGKYLFHAISWFDFQNYKLADSSLIAVIDTETNQLEALLDAPCPGLDTATTDDRGNIYFSGWAFAAGAVYLKGGAKACAVMIPAGSNTLDPSFKLSFAELTGHEAAGLRYLGDDKLIMQVFDESKTAYNADGGTISDWVYAESWYFATYDIVTHEYRALKNLGYFEGGYYSERLADQFFLLAKRAAETDYVRLSPDGALVKGITVDGWASRVFALP